MGGRGAKSHIAAPRLRLVVNDDAAAASDDGAEVERGNANTPSGYTFNDLPHMTDAEMASVVRSARNAVLPNNLHDDLTQRVIYSLGMNGTPQIIGEDVLKQAVDSGATALYRTVNPVPRRRLTADDVANDIRYGSLFNTGGWGGQAYGGGMYMSDNYRGSRDYGRGHGAHMLGGIFNSNARVATDYTIRQNLKSFIQARPQLARALGVSDSSGVGLQTKTTLAIMMGYTAIQSDVGGGEHYYTVFDRSTLTVSKKNYYHSRL